MKLWPLFALVIAGSAFSQKTDLELDRYPFVVSFTETNSKYANDLDTIRYTNVLRWSPKNEKDLSDPLKTYSKNYLTNNSIVAISEAYPSWLVDQISEFNKGKPSKELIRVFGKAYSFGGARYYTSYRASRKVRKENGKIGYITEETSIDNSKKILAEGKFSKRAAFAFNPSSFDNEENHILKFNSKSQLYAKTLFEAKASLAGKELEFIKTSRGRYKYKLTCHEDYPQYLEPCSKSLKNHYNSIIRDPKEALTKLMYGDALKKLENACMRCDLEPYFIIKDPEEHITKAAGLQSSDLVKQKFVPTDIYLGEHKAEESEVFQDLFAIDKTFSFLKDNLNHPEEFQTMISKVNNVEIASLNYPRNTYGSFHYQEIQKGVKEGSRTLINPYTACMLHKTQRSHLKKIVTEEYKNLNSDFSKNLKECLIKNHPEYPEQAFESPSVITELFKKSDHPCSDLILNTGMAFQYGDISSAYGFGKMQGHETHTAGKCVDSRPMRLIHIDRATFLEKLEHQIKIIKNEDVINDINSFIRTLTYEFFEHDTSLTPSSIEILIPQLFHKEKNEDGSFSYINKTKKLDELSSELRTIVLSEYINHSIYIHDKGLTNPGVVAYFQYSLKAIDGNYKAVKDENLTNKFIRLLKDIGADHETLAYSKGNTTLGSYTHKNQYEKLGLEETRSWSGHTNHVHFCFDYSKVEEKVERLIKIYKEEKNKNQYVSKVSINDVINEGQSLSDRVDHFQGIRNKLECMQFIPSKLNEKEKKKEILEIINSLNV